jgi:hypothetical protein
MWIKVLGVLCAGVFIGAALVEAVQPRKRSKKTGEAGADHEGAGPNSAEDKGAAPTSH